MRIPPLILGFVILLSPGPALAQSSETVRRYDDGTRRLEAGDYAGAVAAYEEVLATGTASRALYYNMGIAQYRLDRLGQAVRYFEKVLAVEPGDRLAQHNLDIVRSKLTDRITRLPEPVWRRFGRFVVHTFGTSGLFSIGAAAWLALASIVALVVRRGRATDWMRRGILVSASVAVLFLGAAFIGSAVPPSGERSVVVAETATLASSAGSAEPVQELHEGTVVEVLETREGWARVRLLNGTTGWIDTAGLAPI